MNWTGTAPSGPTGRSQSRPGARGGPAWIISIPVSGIQVGDDSSRFNSCGAARRGSPPSGGTSQTCRFPSRVDSKASSDPSGDQAGRRSAPVPAVIM